MGGLCTYIFPAMSIEKRINIRKPLTDQEEKCGHTYYGPADIDTVLGTFESLPGLDRADFARVLEDAAWWYVNFENEERDQAASTRERFWQIRLWPIEDLLKKLNLTDRQLGHLEAAASDVDKRDGAPRGFEPEHDPLPSRPGDRASGAGAVTIWPVEQQIQMAFAYLEWLRSCVEQAKARANKERTGRGKQPDEARNDFLETAIQLYERCAKSPSKPSRDGYLEEVRGEVIDFLKACLEPLAVRTTPDALYSAYRRIKGK